MRMNSNSKIIMRSFVFGVYAGGPGSGKVTHCDTLMEERRGVTHINMMDLLHQHVISNGMYMYEFNEMEHT